MDSWTGTCARPKDQISHPSAGAHEGLLQQLGGCGAHVSGRRQRLSEVASADQLKISRTTTKGIQRSSGWLGRADPSRMWRTILTPLKSRRYLSITEMESRAVAIN